MYLYLLDPAAALIFLTCVAVLTQNPGRDISRINPPAPRQSNPSHTRKSGPTGNSSDSSRTPNREVRS